MVDALLAIAFVWIQTPKEPAAGAGTTLEAELAGLDEAWRAGNLEDANAHARHALRMIEGGDCPWRSDAAVAAALGGLSARATGRGGGFFFWVADQVDQRLSVLPTSIASIAEDQRAEPGRFPSSDGYFLRSAYFEPETIDAGCAEAQLDPDIFFVEPASAEAVLIAVRWPRDYSEPLWRRAELLFAYPDGEGRALYDQLRDRRTTFSVQRGVDLRRFDPCLALPGPDYAYFEICREGAAP